MHTPKNTWDVERATAWLRRHGWGEGGEDPAPALVPSSEPAAVAPEAEDIDIACWPALVAPFYD
jgi:hypothetical protein